MTLEDIQPRDAADVFEIDTVGGGTRRADVDQRKTILLFSDGTGNSSGRLNRTNVWKMYQTVDLGVPEKPSDRVQIGRYDNGVGNSAFRPFAMLQGIFGWGLKRNILSLYLFLCRNFREGDSICLFGFSRGAFTVRVLADMIDKQGVISHTHGDALVYLVADAYREYRRGQRPRMVPMRWLVPLYKWLRSSFTRLWRKVRFQLEYSRVTRLPASIDFLGVWDTVSAYGGPIVELVRAVDDWIMPISFTDNRLPECVKTARHALALDDERDSFQPLPWDEKSEGKASRLEQVWFAGMHADVGGGYPDDSLSYVSFNWMVAEARQLAGIRLRKERVKDALEQADSFGPIHDSRAGLAGYYRYQPRRISALMWPVDQGGRYLVDPEQVDDQGMLPPIKVHESVLRRIRSGTDGYAPISIPRSFTIVKDRSLARNRAGSAGFLTRVTSRSWQDSRGKAQDRIWDLVWWRRVLYFLIVLASLGLLTMPTWSFESVLGSSAVLELLFQGMDNLTFGLLDDWFDAYMQLPIETALLAGTIVFLFNMSNRLENRLRNASRAIWLNGAQPVATASPAPAAPSGRTLRLNGYGQRKSLVYRLRTFPVYQDTLNFVRWTLLPSLVGLGLLVSMVVAVLTIGSMALLTWNERQDLFCDERPWPAGSEKPEAEFWMSTNDPCNTSPLRVSRGTTYSVRFAIPADQVWKDGGHDATPAGIRAGELLPLGLDRALVGMRRSPDARWMQPLAYIVSDDHSTRTEPLTLEYDPVSRVAHGQFTARRNGRLAIAVNEAVPPWPSRIRYFYDGRANDGSERESVRNRGGACVHIVPASVVGSDAQRACTLRPPAPTPGE